MAWWAQPLPEPEPSVAATDAEVMTEEGRRKAWRMLALIDAFRHRHEDPLSLDEIDLLGRVASGNHDLHDACAALRNGCGLEHFVIIFT